MGRIARTWLLSMLLGFHNAWEQEDVDLAELGIRIHATNPGSMYAELAHPERCFFWGASSLLN
jgi:hypothetical protein